MSIFTFIRDIPDDGQHIRRVGQNRQFCIQALCPESCVKGLLNGIKRSEINGHFLLPEQELISATDFKDAFLYLKGQETKVQQVTAFSLVKSIINPTAGAVVTQKRSTDAYTDLGGEVI